MDRHGTRITTTSENRKKKNAYSAEDVSLCSADKFLVAGGLTHVGKTSHFADGGCEHPLGSGVTSHTHTQEGGDVLYGYTQILHLGIFCLK